MVDLTGTHAQALRFAVVGLFSNAVLFVAYVALTSVGLGPKLAMSLMYVVGVMQTYVFNKRWTFNHGGRHNTAFIRYISVYAGGYVANLVALTWLVDEIGLPHQIVQGMMILTLALGLFILQKFWVFTVD